MYYVSLNVVAVIEEEDSNTLRYHRWPASITRIGGDHLMDVKNIMQKYVEQHQSFELVDIFMGGMSLIVIVALSEREFSRAKLTRLSESTIHTLGDGLSVTIAPTIVERYIK